MVDERYTRKSACMESSSVALLAIAIAVCKLVKCYEVKHIFILLSDLFTLL